MLGHAFMQACKCALIFIDQTRRFTLALAHKADDICNDGINARTGH